MVLAAHLDPGYAPKAMQVTAVVCRIQLGALQLPMDWRSPEYSCSEMQLLGDKPHASVYREVTFAM